MAEAKTDGLRQALLRRYEQAAEATADSTREALASAAPRKSGALQQSIEVHVERRAEGTFVIVAESPLVQAATTNYGARPHTIRGNPLSFYWPKAGKQVFARTVRHPGNVGTGWWTNVIGRVSSLFAGNLEG